MAKADYGDPSGWEYYEQGNLVNWVQTYIEPYIKVIGHKTCVSNERCLGLALPYSLQFAKPGSVNTTVGQYVVTKTGDSVAYAFFRYGGVYEPVTRVKVYIRNPKNMHLLAKMFLLLYSIEVRQILCLSLMVWGLQEMIC